jgi:enoyl-CoA hydratase/carnithine racemase
VNRKDIHMKDVVTLQIKNEIAHLTLANPDAYNALSETMMAELQAAFDSLAQNKNVRVIVLAAVGKAFCAGHDLKEMRAKPSAAYYQDLFARCSKLMMTIQHIPIPVIARVQGIATAAGCQLVAACDLAVASNEAKFAVSGVNLGLFCSTPGVALSRNVLRKQAMEMLLTGGFISAQEAVQRGLINHAVAADALDAKIDELAQSICAKPRVAIAMGKRLFYEQLEMGTEAAYQLAGHAMACNMMDDSALEVVQAFIEKRVPAWEERVPSLKGEH